MLQKKGFILLSSVISKLVGKFKVEEHFRPGNIIHSSKKYLNRMISQLYSDSKSIVATNLEKNALNGTKNLYFKETLEKQCTNRAKIMSNCDK